MNEELKPCPYCGHEPDSRISDTDGNKYYTCGSKWCRNGNWYTLEEWNTRPLEDALQKRIDFVENKADQFNEGFQAARNGEPDRPIELEESNAWMEGYAYGAYLPMKQRITELESQLRWIPVSEKPTKSMYVLICHVGDDYARTSWYSENEGDFYWWGDKQDLDLWRPLPVAPKEVRA